MSIHQNVSQKNTVKPTQLPYNCQNVEKTVQNAHKMHTFRCVCDFHTKIPPTPPYLHFDGDFGYILTQKQLFYDDL